MDLYHPLRPVALKQCLQLPKPLYHEVMELAGGRLSELSKLELLKRDDLADDDEIAFNAGSHTELIRLSYADFERLVEPKKLHFARVMR